MKLKHSLIATGLFISLVPSVHAQMVYRNDDLDRLQQEVDENKEDRLMQRAQRIEAMRQQHEFVEKFNAVVRAMADFAERYKTNNSVDVRKMKALRKAWKDLEQTDSWFSGSN
jgi:hypothetical protein